MNSIDTWLNEHLEGLLTGEQSKLFTDEMARNPEAYQQVIHELDMVDLIEQVFSPARSDEAFLSQLSIGLDQADGGDYGDSGEGGDGGDPGGDFTPDLPVDPGASGGMSTSVKVWTGLVLSIGIGAGVAVMKTGDEPISVTNPENPTEPVALVSANSEWIDIIAEADVELHKGDSGHAARADAAYTLYVHGSRGKNARCRILMRFDLSLLPDRYERVELRLTPAFADQKSPEPVLFVAADDEWSEESRESTAPMPDEVLTTWRPLAGEASALDVTEAVAREKARDGKITFAIGGPNWKKPTKGFLFYARHYGNDAFRPTLRIYTKAGDGRE